MEEYSKLLAGRHFLFPTLNTKHLYCKAKHLLVRDKTFES